MTNKPGIIKKTLGDGVKQAERGVEKVVDNEGLAKRARRYPHLFALMGGLGALLVVYGFNQIFDATSFFKQYPYVTVILGLFLLSVGSSVYKRISR